MNTPREIRFKGKTYFVNSPLVPPEEINRLIGAFRTPNTQLLERNGTTARPVRDNIRTSESGYVELVEIPNKTVKGNLLRTLRQFFVNTSSPPAPSVRSAAAPAVQRPQVAPPTRSSVPVVPTPRPAATTPPGRNSQRETYIKVQVASLASAFGARFGEPIQLTNDFNYLFIPRFPLSNFWNMRETPVLIRFPDTYPALPPNGFYISRHCRGARQADRHILGRNVYTGEDLSQFGWNWYCVHCQENWMPGGTPNEPMNLWTFIYVIQSSLSIGEF